MPVRFQQLALNDNSAPAIIEDAFRAYGSFAGIHNFSFDTTYEISSGGWTLDAGLSLTAVERQGYWDDLTTNWDDGTTGWA